MRAAGTCACCLAEFWLVVLSDVWCVACVLRLWGHVGEAHTHLWWPELKGTGVAGFAGGVMWVPGEAGLGAGGVLDDRQRLCTLQPESLQLWQSLPQPARHLERPLVGPGDVHHPAGASRPACTLLHALSPSLLRLDTISGLNQLELILARSTVWRFLECLNPLLQCCSVLTSVLSPEVSTPLAHDAVADRCPGSSFGHARHGWQGLFFCVSPAHVLHASAPLRASLCIGRWHKHQFMQADGSGRFLAAWPGAGDLQHLLSMHSFSLHDTLSTVSTACAGCLGAAGDPQLLRAPPDDSCE